MSEESQEFFKKAIWISDLHFGYPKSRVRNGILDESIEPLSKYDMIMFGGDNADLHFIYHMTLLNLIKEALFNGEIEGDKENWPKTVWNLFFKATQMKEAGAPDIKPGPDGHLRIDPVLKKCIHKAVDETIGYLDDFIGKIIEKNPNCVITAVLGNHDNYKHFWDMLKKLEEKYPNNFKCHQEYFRIGPALFTHLDTVIAKEDLENREILKLKSYMQSWVFKEIEGFVHNTIRNTVFRFWNHAAFVVDRLVEGLAVQKNMKIHLDEITHVFGGHIHSDPFILYLGKDGRFYSQPGCYVGDGTSTPIEIEFKTKSARIIFGGEESNVALLDAEVVNVNQVYIAGLTHVQGAGWVSKLANNLAPKVIKESSLFKYVFNPEREHWLLRILDGFDGHQRIPGQGEWCVLDGRGEVIRSPLVR